MKETSQNIIEAEIAELAKIIEQKRSQLETREGIMEEKDLVSDSLKEKLSETSAVFAQQSSQRKCDPQKGMCATAGASYLDSLDEGVADKVNYYIQIAFKKGLQAVSSEIEKEEPVVMDAFHDALTDRYYEEFKSRGIIK